MGKRKMLENVEKYMIPVEERLDPYWAEVFTMVFRGKQRGEGLMVATDRIRDMEDAMNNKIKKLQNDFDDKIRREHNISDDVSHIYLSDHYPGDYYKDRDKYVEKRLTQDDIQKLYAIQIANEIKTTERGSWISANNLFSYGSHYTDANTVMAAYSVFLNLRRNPNWMPKPPAQAEEPSWIGKCYGGTREKRAKSLEIQNSMVRG